MNWLTETLITGITIFAATNIDDILILILLFAQVDTNLQRRHIVVGHYLGFIIIIAASLPGFFGGLILPRAWIGLLGILPIIFGIIRLIKLAKNNPKEVQTVSSDFNQSAKNPGLMSSFASILSPEAYKVAAITLANSGDNIGIYIPFFAKSNSSKLGVIMGLFFILIGVWCYIGYQLTRHPIVAQFLTRYGRPIVPLILIGLGIYILIDSGTLTLIPQWR